MAHKFNPHEYWKLESPERKKVLPPSQTLLTLGLKQGDRIADIGCGIGYFTIPALEIVGPHGRVYALDTSELLLQELKRRLTVEQLKRVQLIKTEEYHLGVPPESVTFAFMSAVLHEIDNRSRFLREVRKIMTPKGRLAIVEWEKKVGKLGPPYVHRLGKEEVEGLLTELKYRVVQRIDIQGELYAFVAMKSVS